MRRGFSKGLRYTIDLTKIADRENPRTVEAPLNGGAPGQYVIDWGDGSVVEYNSASSISHNYTDSPGNVFQVIIRSATGGLPNLRFNSGGVYANPSSWNLSYAVVSIDHFHGEVGTSSSIDGGYLLRNCENVQYCDPRLFGYYKWNSLAWSACVRYNTSKRSAITQPLESFCFDFLTQCATFESIFYGCVGLTGQLPPGLFRNCISINYFNAEFYGCTGLTGPVPSGFFNGQIGISQFQSIFWACTGLTSVASDLFDSHTQITNVRRLFMACTGLTGEPYKFWEKGFAANITTPDYCYSGCTGLDLSHIPTAYGGTMTVS